MRQEKGINAKFKETYSQEVKRLILQLHDPVSEFVLKFCAPDSSLAFLVLLNLGIESVWKFVDKAESKEETLN